MKHIRVKTDCRIDIFKICLMRKWISQRNESMVCWMSPVTYICKAGSTAKSGNTSLSGCLSRELLEILECATSHWSQLTICSFVQMFFSWSSWAILIKRLFLQFSHISTQFIVKWPKAGKMNTHFFLEIFPCNRFYPWKPRLQVTVYLYWEKNLKVWVLNY